MSCNNSILDNHSGITVIVIHHLPLSLEKHWVVEGKRSSSIFRRSGNWGGNWTNLLRTIVSIIQSRASGEIKDILICLEFIPLCTATYSSTTFLTRQEESPAHFFSCISGKEISSWVMQNSKYLNVGTAELMAWEVVNAPACSRLITFY